MASIAAGRSDDFLVGPCPSVVEAEETDDVFTSPDRTAYRLKASTGIATTG